jgi:hypothetical protein
VRSWCSRTSTSYRWGRGPDNGGAPEAPCPSAPASPPPPPARCTSAAPAPRSTACCTPAAKAASFLLRIEDTDQARSTEEAAAGILRESALARARLGRGPRRRGRGHRPLLPEPTARELYDQLRRLAARLGPRLPGLGLHRGARRPAQGGRSGRSRTLRYRWSPTSPEAEARFRAEGRQPVVRLDAPSGPRAPSPTDVLGDVAVSGRGRSTTSSSARPTASRPTTSPSSIDDHLHAGHPGAARPGAPDEHAEAPRRILTALGWSPAEPRPPAAHLQPHRDGKMSKRDKAKAARAAAIAAGAAARGRRSSLGLVRRDAHVVPARRDRRAFVGKQHDGVALGRGGRRRRSASTCR